MIALKDASVLWREHVNVVEIPSHLQTLDPRISFSFLRRRPSRSEPRHPKTLRIHVTISETTYAELLVRVVEHL